MKNKNHRIRRRSLARAHRATRLSPDRRKLSAKKKSRLYNRSVWRWRINAYKKLGVVMVFNLLEFLC
jgi:hypothetical protein